MYLYRHVPGPNVRYSGALLQREVHTKQESFDEQVKVLNMFASLAERDATKRVGVSRSQASKDHQAAVLGSIAY